MPLVSCGCTNREVRKFSNTEEISNTEATLDYTCNVSAKEDTIYVSEGGKVDLTLTINGNRDEAINAAYTLRKLGEEGNKKGHFSLSSNASLHYGENLLTYTPLKKWVITTFSSR